MSRKNFTVATAEDGKTTLVKIEKTNVPTGKVVTLEDKKKRREEREEAYCDFRINSLKRRAARMKVPQAEIDKAVEKLKKQLKEPNTYTILVMYNPNDDNMVKEALDNNKIKYLFKSNSHVYLEGDAAVLATIREIMPASAKIHPYVKKKPSVLVVVSNTNAKKKPKKGGSPHTSLHQKTTHSKRYNIARMSKKNKKVFKQKVKSLRDTWKAQKKQTLTVVHKDTKKASESPKIASTNVKKAA